MSLALVFVALAAGASACARVQPSAARDEAAAPGPRATLLFDNAANDYVDVYLVAEQRQWRLGRVSPGAKATLQLPADELAVTPGFVRLVVLAGAPISMQAARDPHAVVSIAEPVSEVLHQRWTFSHSQSMAPQIFGSRAPDRRR
jgi:hypothetical protein